MRTPSSETFRFFMPTEIHCGVGVADDLQVHLSGLPSGPVAAVVDPGIAGQKGVRKVIENLERRGPLKVLDGPRGEPDFEYLETLKAAAGRPDLVAGIGGGSSMDSAKGLAIVLNNPGPCEQYQGKDLYKNPGVPCVTVPTLFGSGAEITPSAVFVNRAANRKGGINGRAVFPRLALVDPCLMLEAPLSIAAATAMDGLVHAIESYAARCATPVTRTLAGDAARVLFAALVILDDSHRRLEALTLLADGAFKAILSLMHSEQGLTGAASYPMGVHCAVPHGVAGGRALPHALRLNESRRPGLWDGMAARALDWTGKDGLSSAEALAGRLSVIANRYGVPGLSRWLVGADLDLLARDTHAFRGIMDQNPVDLDFRSIREFFAVLAADGADRQPAKTHSHPAIF